MPGLPEVPAINHWHAWVDNCLGMKTELRTPFKDAVRMTEATLLAVKATRFPGQELRWDKSTSPSPTMRRRPRPSSAANTAKASPRREWVDGKRAMILIVPARHGALRIISPTLRSVCTSISRSRPA